MQQQCGGVGWGGVHAAAPISMLWKLHCAFHFHISLFISVTFFCNCCYFYCLLLLLLFRLFVLLHFSAQLFSSFSFHSQCNSPARLCVHCALLCLLALERDTRTATKQKRRRRRLTRLLDGYIPCSKGAIQNNPNIFGSSIYQCECISKCRALTA